MKLVTLHLRLAVVLITGVLGPSIAFGDPLPADFAQARAERERKSERIEITWHQRRTEYDDEDSPGKPVITTREKRLTLLLDGYKIRLYEIPISAALPSPAGARENTVQWRSKLAVFDGKVSGGYVDIDSRPPQASEIRGKGFASRLDVTIAPLLWCVRPLYSLEGRDVLPDLKEILSIVVDGHVELSGGLVEG